MANYVISVNTCNMIYFSQKQIKCIAPCFPTQQIPLHMPRLFLYSKYIHLKEHQYYLFVFPGISGPVCFKQKMSYITGT